MGKTRKEFSFNEKLEAVEKYLRGEGSLISIAHEYGVHHNALHQWIANYEAMGPSVLLPTRQKKRYPVALRIAAVEAYLRGEGSLRELCMKFKIRSRTQLINWIKLYNNGHIDQWEKKSQRRRIRMTKGRATTLEERMEIVSFCIANGKNYGLTMNKYGVSYQQVYSWVWKYEERGMDGLMDRRGKRKPLEEMSEIERLRAENKRLRAEIEQKEMENAILKKIQEIERRRYSAEYVKKSFT